MHICRRGCSVVGDKWGMGVGTAQWHRSEWRAPSRKLYVSRTLTKGNEGLASILAKGNEGLASILVDQQMIEKTSTRERRRRLRIRSGRTATSTVSRRRERGHSEVLPIWEEPSRARTSPESVRLRGFPSRDAVFRRSLALADLLGAAAALLFAAIVIGTGSVTVRPTALLMTPFIILVSKAIGLYDRDQNTLRKSTIDELPSILKLVSRVCADGVAN